MQLPDKNIRTIVLMAYTKKGGDYYISPAIILMNHDALKS